MVYNSLETDLSTHCIALWTLSLKHICTQHTVISVIVKVGTLISLGVCYEICGWVLNSDQHNSSKLQSQKYVWKKNKD